MSKILKYIKSIIDIALVIILCLAGALLMQIFNTVVALAIDYTEVTFYPDADPEITSCDGFAKRGFTSPNGETWSVIHDTADGTVANAASAGGYGISILYENAINKFRNLTRSYFLFDTSALPDGCVIDSAIIHVYVYGGQDPANWDIGACLYTVETDSDTDIIVSDYDITNFGTDELSNVIMIDDMNLSGYNEFTLNSDGLDNIDVAGISRFGLCESEYDIPDIEPVHADSHSFIYTYKVEQGGDYMPKLVITYHMPTIIPPSDFTATRYNLNTANVSWTKETSEVLLRASMVDYPASTSDGWLVYEGTADYYLHEGIPIDYWVVYYSGWGLEGETYSDNYSTTEIGGETPMELELSQGMYIMGFGLVLLFVSFFFKSPIIRMALVLAMLAVIFEPTFKDTWYQTAAIFIAIWAGVSMFYRLTQGEEGKE